MAIGHKNNHLRLFLPLTDGWTPSDQYYMDPRGPCGPRLRTTGLEESNTAILLKVTPRSPSGMFNIVNCAAYLDVCGMFGTTVSVQNIEMQHQNELPRWRPTTLTAGQQ